MLLERKVEMPTEMGMDIDSSHIMVKGDDDV